MLYIGLDIGTTGAKALLVDEKGTALDRGYAGYSLISDGARVEQRADDWTECGANAIRQVLLNRDASQIAAVALSTQGASTVAVDAANRPIGNALTWMDTRAAQEAKELGAALGDEYIYRSTGWRINPALDAAKIMYMKRSGSYGSARRFLSTLEYMNLFLTGNPVCDPTNSCMRQMYNITEGGYDARILDAAGIEQSELPDIVPTGALVGRVTQQASAATGLVKGTPVYNGAHDQYCASLGAASSNIGDLLLSAGTTWVVMGIGDKPLFTDTYIAPGVHPIPGLYGVMASLVGSGASLQWFKDRFIGEDFDEINKQVSIRAEKMQDLFFYPYLSGAHYPEWLLDARGTFSGIALEHDKFDFARAIMEAAAFSVRRAVEDFSGNGFSPKTLRVMGGAANSAVWCSLIAAALDIPVEVCDQKEACALGAAIIAATGDGAYESFHGAVEAMAGKARLPPQSLELSAILGAKYAKYRRMWDGIARYYQ